MGTDFIEEVAKEYAWRYALPPKAIVTAWRMAQRRPARERVVERLRLPEPYDVQALARTAEDVLARRVREGIAVDRGLL